MRFSAPRSTSPSPERSSQLSPSSSRTFALRKPQQRRRACSYGLRDDSDSASEGEDEDEESNESDDDDGEGATPGDDSDSDVAESLQYVSISPTRNPLRPRLDPLEARRIEDTVAAIRLHTRHYDPYEDWEKQTRRDAFRTARKDQSTTLHDLHTSQINKRAAKLNAVSTTHAAQRAKVAQELAARKVRHQQEEAEMRRYWAEKEKDMWASVEVGIKVDEERVRVALEEERRRREEEERKRREEELKRRLEAERIKAAEEKRRREEEEQREQERLREEERRRQEEAAIARKEREKAEENARKALGLTTAEEDWYHARMVLKRLKIGPMKTVKADKQLKSAWSVVRRQITPKIGQLTNDTQSINRISHQLHALLVTNPPHPEVIYISLLSSLSKAILLQAETEVTASKAAAGPLAQVAANLLGVLPHFSDIFYAKLVQRAGGWAVPTTIPNTDIDVDYATRATTPIEFTQATRDKAMGYRLMRDGARETQGEYIVRVAGIMRVYFLVLVRATVDGPLERMWQTPRYWTYFARMMGGAVDIAEVGSAVAPEVLYAALDVGGGVAAQIWGHQWIKMLALLYEGVSTGSIGGTSPEGKAARVRVQLEIERIMSGAKA